jgi:hypothetical protein
VFLLGAFVVRAETEQPHTVTKDSKQELCSTCHQFEVAVATKGLLETKNNPVDRESFS